MFSRHYMLLLYFCRSFSCLIAICTLSPFVGTQKCYSVDHNKVLFCAALSLLKYWVTVNYKCYKVQRLTPDSGTNKKRKKHDTQWSCNLRLRCVLLFLQFYFCKKGSLNFPLWLLPPIHHQNTPPGALHTKEFESALGWRHATPG